MSDSVLPSHRGDVESNRFKHGVHPLANLRFDRRRTFKNLLSDLLLFFTATWLDWLCILIIGATAAGVWVAPHTFTRLIPVTGPSGDIYYPEIAYPYVEPVFSSVLAGVLSALIPIVVMLASQLWIQSFDDFSHGVLGLAYSMVTGTCFQVILKKTIGGLRPHFLAVCQPVMPPLKSSVGVGYQNVMWTAEQICTGDAKRVKNALESFPSGHSEVAFAGLGYLAIYLFAHLQIRSTRRRRGSYWRMLFIVAPLLLATYLASTLVLGYHHHGYDVIFGALIGVIMAVFGYRMVFRGVWDPKWNTVPVTRNTRNDETSESLEMPRRSQELLNGNPAYEGASHKGASHHDQHGPKRQPV